MNLGDTYYGKKAIELSRVLESKLTEQEFDLLVEMMGDDDLDMLVFHELRLIQKRRQTTEPAPP